MRKIKFRGKRIDNGEWVYGSMVVINHLAYIVFRHKDDTYTTFMGRAVIEVDLKTVGQYTGLKDKNGREIYEGDVVEYSSQGDGGGRDIWRGSVEFTDNAFQVRLVDGCNFNGSHEFLCDWSGCEVIGNIHENPEQLNA